MRKIKPCVPKKHKWETKPERSGTRVCTVCKEEQWLMQDRRTRTVKWATRIVAPLP